MGEGSSPMVLSEVGGVSILGARVTWNLWWRTEASPGVLSRVSGAVQHPKSHFSLFTATQVPV